MSARPKIVLLGMLTKMPVGGVAWLVAQYAVGFERLGYEVYYVEAHARTPSMFVRDEHDDGTDAAAAYLGSIMERFGLRDRWAFQALHADGRCIGMSSAALDRLYGEAALIINMHGGTVPLPEHAATGRLILLSTDPVELELEIERSCARALAFLEPHVACFTWGLNYGNADCRLPWAAAHRFIPSPPPIVLDLWPSAPAPAGASLTTIGNWRQDWREVLFDGERYGWSKHQEFMKVIDLPRRTHGRLELALSSAHDSDRAMLREHGWSIVDGLSVSADMDDYRSYITGSAGEFSVAKDQNVRFRSGWFSERSTCYLAAGRPVVVQDTGFGSWLPVGSGLLSFHDVDSAAAAVADVLGDPRRHERAAREIALEHLSHEVVLSDLLRHVGLAPAVGASSMVRRAISAAMSSARGSAAPDLNLDLRPVTRRPLVLTAETDAKVLSRPVPAINVAGAPAASIVVVVLDNLTVSRLALESVLANTQAAYELIVVDNGSELSVRHYLSVLATRNPHVRVLTNTENVGFAPAVNQGVREAASEIVVLLNNDVITPPGWLDGLLAPLRDPAVGIVGPVTNRCGNEAQIRADYVTYGDLLQFVEHRRRAGAPPDFDIRVATMFCVAMRRDTMRAIGDLDERFVRGMFEDDDYCRRAREAGLRVVCTPSVFVHHFGEASLGRLAADGSYGDLFEDNRRRFEEKWGEPWQQHSRVRDEQYAEEIARVHCAIAACVPDANTCLIVSKGDERLVPPGDRALRHFPAVIDGTYVGHHPTDDADAITRLENARAIGADAIVFPSSSAWWLTHYRGFAAHLESNYRQLLDEPETAVIYSLHPDENHQRLTTESGTDRAAPTVDSLLVERDELRRQLRGVEHSDLPALLAQIARRLDQMEDLFDDAVRREPAGVPVGDDADERLVSDVIRCHVPRGGHVLVVASAGTEPVSATGRTLSSFPVDCVAGEGAVLPTLSLVARLEAMRAGGAEYLVMLPDVAERLHELAGFADHVVGTYAMIPTESALLLFDVRRHDPQVAPAGTSRALTSVVERIANVAGGDAAVLDWTESIDVDGTGAMNVFRPHTDGASLPHLDRSVPIVLIDDPARSDEAMRVATDAVISVGLDLRPVALRIDAVDAGTYRQLVESEPLGIVGGGTTADPAWSTRVREALAEHELVDIASRSPLPSPLPDLIAVLSPGVVPLPGCVAAARAARRWRSDVGAVAVKLLDAFGAVDAAGVTAFVDGSWSSIANGCVEPTAPWHEFRRDVCAGAGALFIGAEAFAAVLAASGDDPLPADPVQWSAAVWGAGYSVVYEPDAAAVRCAEPHTTARSDTSFVWPTAARRPARGPDSGGESFWRLVLATDDVRGSCGIEAPAGELQVAG